MRNILFIALLGLAGCDQPPPAAVDAPREPAPPPKGWSKLNVTINQDDTSDFSFTMRSNGRTPAEATEFAIKALKERVAQDGKIQVEKMEK